jgi:hypothetical protein
LAGCTLGHGTHSLGSWLVVGEVEEHVHHIHGATWIHTVRTRSDNTQLVRRNMHRQINMKFVTTQFGKSACGQSLGRLCELYEEIAHTLQRCTVGGARACGAYGNRMRPTSMLIIGDRFVTFQRLMLDVGVHKL